MALPIAAASIASAAYINAKYNITRDLNYILNAKRAENAAAKAVAAKRANIYYLLEEVIAQKPKDEICLWTRHGEYSWSQVLLRIHQYGNYFKALGIKPADTVALYLQNSAEFLFIWYGLLSIGVAAAFINYNLASDALVHCVKLSGAKFLLVDEDAGCQSRIAASSERLSNDAGIKQLNITPEFVAEVSRGDTSRSEDALRIEAEGKIPAAYIYTSGTTGLAKAIPITMIRLYMGIIMFRKSTWRQEGDRWYICMPLYHGTGALNAAQGISAGIKMAIGKKFSTKTFWADVRDSESTGFIYVGETARYLLAAPPSDQDKNHKIRFMLGNGLRPDVWPRFVERFGIQEVLEFFNSTEGMLATAVYTRNSRGQGTVGHHGLVFRLLMHKTLVPVKLDPETGAMYRDPKTGFATRQPYSTGGEILVKVPDRSGFPGYHKNATQTEKMFATNVFQKGDLYYKSGDALKRDDDGFWRFIDRLGDTYRWKGENVSTAEVAEVMGKFAGVDEANIYGLSLPNHDGRAGCAALHLSSSSPFDPIGLAAHARQHLPKYAVPIFIRILTSDVGGLSSHNNKQDKVKLREEGVDPAKLGSRVEGGKGDEIWWLAPARKGGKVGDGKGEGYVRFRREDWDGIVAGKAKL